MKDTLYRYTSDVGVAFASSSVVADQTQNGGESQKLFIAIASIVFPIIKEILFATAPRIWEIVWNRKKNKDA